MIRVCLKNFEFRGDLKVKQNSRECGVIIEGHSGQGKKGADIVCYAVSAVVQTAVAAITRIADIHQDIIQKEGYLESSIYLNNLDDKKNEALHIILNTMIVGLKLIDENYPKTIEIIIE
ncbi:MAG: ribosomal-processing cysteine protease Prp [Spirochaetes bacterium]|nr:ribosomal-processing cysteine protease Prp [Spirochaetota bacterium]